MSIGNDNTVYDENGYDAEGFNAEGFDKHGYDSEGRDSEGYDCDGYGADGYDEHGWNEDGYHRDTGTCFNDNGYTVDGYGADGYDENGWNTDGLNRDTGTEFDHRGRTIDGSYYNDEGYNCDGYDEEGYDADGLDGGGNSREDNERSELGDDFDDQLIDYSGDVLEICEWRQRPGQEDELLAGHEIEMYSDEVDIDDVGMVCSQLWKAYSQHNPQADSCAIGKHDGSLDENGPGGFETVTVPLTREQTYGVFESFDVLGKGHCSAWDKGAEVGHHIHVSLSAISPLTLGKLGVFMNLPANRKFLTAIAQRPPVYNDFEEGKRLTRPKNHARHSVLNLTDHTVEFRLFKANLKARCILKNYEFCIAAIKFCRSTSHQDLNRLDFLKFVAANRKEFGYLHTFLLNHGVWSDAYRAFLPANVAFPKEQGQKPAVDVSTGV